MCAVVACGAGFVRATVKWRRTCCLRLRWAGKTRSYPSRSAVLDFRACVPRLLWNTALIPLYAGFVQSQFLTCCRSNIRHWCVCRSVVCSKDITQLGFRDLAFHMGRIRLRRVQHVPIGFLNRSKMASKTFCRKSCTCSNLLWVGSYGSKASVTAWDRPVDSGYTLTLTLRVAPGYATNCSTQQEHSNHKSRLCSAASTAAAAAHCEPCNDVLKCRDAQMGIYQVCCNCMQPWHLDTTQRPCKLKSTCYPSCTLVFQVWVYNSDFK